MWNEKPVDVQNEDIENFVKDVVFLKDLINRLQAENDTLCKRLKDMKKALFEQQAYASKLQAENEKLNQINFDLCNAGGRILHKVETIKAEAYKEFAERLKKEIYTNIKNNNMTKSQYIAENYKCLSCDFIATSRGKNEGLKTAFKLVNNLLKEMVGEDNV